MRGIRRWYLGGLNGLSLRALPECFWHCLQGSTSERLAARRKLRRTDMGIDGDLLKRYTMATWGYKQGEMVGLMIIWGSDSGSTRRWMGLARSLLET